MRLLLVEVEAAAVRVQLVEDPDQRLVRDGMDHVRQRVRLQPLNLRRGAGHQRVEGVRRRLVAKFEPDDQPKNPCSCCLPRCLRPASQTRNFTASRRFFS